ncbi:MAG: UDP-N-acetylmuramoyl-L-alanyl-D-glutamate--2,6-diaminopimelate ligase [Thermodesulfobacteriota bacterium]
MNLGRLLKTIDLQAHSPEEEAQTIGSIHYDSRDVAPGGLFVAIEGFKIDGHDFVHDAVQRGAAAIVAQHPVTADVPVYPVADTRRALATLADAFFGHPSRELTLIGITGTNGKTTTTYILESILKKSGFNVGVIGTVNYRYNQKEFDNPVTTPESLDLQRIMREMKTDGVSHVVMEVSSHAIDLDRVFGCDLDVAVFTNLTQDHLDYHQDMQSYWQCKKRLFTEYLVAGHGPKTKAAVINVDYPQGRELAREVACSCVAVGHSSENPVRPIEMDMGLQGISGTISIRGNTFRFQTGLTGHHNLENVLCAAGAAVALNLPPRSIQAGIECISIVPGRLQRVPGPTDRPVFVDYAHTPDALENVLRALKALGPDRLICIFGCGGERDRAKRPMMGEISGRLSDLTIVTSDNPRTERPTAIIADILPGLEAIGSLEYRPEDLGNGWREKGYVVEPDRRQAIRMGIEASQAGDIVVIAGKGHETYQIIGNQTLAFSDVEEAAAVIGGRKAGRE